MNISSVSYHVDDLNTFTINCKSKPNFIEISEYRIKQIDLRFQILI